MSTQQSYNFSDPEIEQLQHLRTGFLVLHKVLLEYQRKQYERQVGRVLSKGELFKLVVGDPAFGWLHPLSEFLVSIDTVLDGKSQASDMSLSDLFGYARKLIEPAQGGSEFQQKYFQAIQADPTVALAHAKVKAIAGADEKHEGSHAAV